MPLMGTRGGGSVRGFGRFGKVLVLSFTDTFNRSGNLLNSTTSDGKITWSVTSGTWTTDGSQATSSTGGSSNPTALVNIESENLSSVVVNFSDGGGGYAAAFWSLVSGAGWTAYDNYYSQSESYNVCGGQGYYSTCTNNCSSCGSKNWYIVYCECGNGDSCGGAVNSGDLCAPCYSCCASRGGLSFCDPGETYYKYSQNTTSTRLRYYSQFKIDYFNGSTNTNQTTVDVANQLVSYNKIYSLEITTNANIISYKGYSAVNKGGSQIFNSTYSPSSPTKGGYVGISKRSVTDNSGSGVDSITVAVV
jgi:hypothetical protein